MWCDTIKVSKSHSLVSTVAVLGVQNGNGFLHGFKLDFTSVMKCYFFFFLLCLCYVYPSLPPRASRILIALLVQPKEKRDAASNL